jgi:anti-sigma factor RsiW
MNTEYPPLSLERFADRLDTHGSNLDAWPDAEREAARALLAQSEAARSELRRAEALEAALRELPRPEVSPALLARVLAIPDAGSRRTGAPARTTAWPFRGPRVPTLLFGSAALCGVLLGLFAPEGTSLLGTQNVRELGVQALGADEAGAAVDDPWDELDAIAFAGDFTEEDP